jgi:hypothetical protein
MRYDRARKNLDRHANYILAVTQAEALEGSSDRDGRVLGIAGRSVRANVLTCR